MRRLLARIFHGVSTALRLFGRLDISSNMSVLPLRRAPCSRTRLTIIVTLVSVLTPCAFTAADLEPVPRNIKSMTIPELVRAGDERRGIKDYPEAIRYLEEALRRDKKDETIYNKIGIAYMFDGDADAAKHAFNRAVKLKPDYTNALNNLGVINFNQKRFKSAEKYFRKVVELEETRAVFHVNLGVVLFNQRKYEAAMNEYARAFELDPEVLERSARAGATVQITSPAQRARFYFELAKVQAGRGDIEDCLRRLTSAKEYGYRRLADVYRDELFIQLWNDARLHEIVAPPATK